MAPAGPPAKGAWGPIPSANALGTVEETPLATAGSTRPPAITAAPLSLVQWYQGAWRSHLPLLMSICIPSEGTRNPKKASSTRLLETVDLNGLHLLSPILIINHITPTPIHLLFVFNDNTKVNCAQVPTHAATPSTTPTILC